MPPALAGSLALVALLLLQAPGDGWAIATGSPREVRHVYWDLFQTTEVWVRLVPEDPQGGPRLLNLVFQALFPGRAERDPYSGRPQWPSGTPRTLRVRAEPLPTTVVRELSLRLVIDGRSIDLAGPDHPHRTLPCVVASEDCSPNAVEADLDPSTLRCVAGARSVGGEALGFPFRLVAADQAALGEFLDRVGLKGGEEPKGGP
jgi:hypothetical protein